MKTTYLLALFGFISCQLAPAQQPAAASSLDFTSSVPSLVDTFRWAKHQALVYTRVAPQAIGPWYEAALPGRNAFCMRDVSHQTEGAAALGLFAANRNMLSRFAQSINESRDWAAYWEIDGNGNPSPADYVSDKDFWFNLPANFDVLDATVRMWRWTGDDSYRNDPVFERFFRLTSSDYIKRWQLEPETILKRPRIANQRQATGQFVQSRGIPSYAEGSKDFILGSDLLAAEYRAIRSFDEIASEKDKEFAHKLQSKADAIQSLLERAAWSKKDQHYLGTIRQDQSGYGSGDALVLYFGAGKDPTHIHAALDYLSLPTYWKHINIEEESYIPLTLFRYGRNEAAYQVLADISSPHKDRRDYPEVSYSVIETVVSGIMGLELGHPSDNFDVSTLSRLPNGRERATLAGISIKRNQVDVTHAGHSSSLRNISGPAVRWRAQFSGSVANLTVNGKKVSATHSSILGRVVSWTDVTVPPGTAAEVSR